MRDTNPEIVFPVRTWADYCRESEDARPVIEETNEIPAAEAPTDDRVRLTPEQVKRVHRLVKSAEICEVCECEMADDGICGACEFDDEAT